MKNLLKYFTYFSLILFFLSSCVSKQSLSDLYESSSSDLKIEDLNGIYENDHKGINLLNRETIWYQFRALSTKDKLERWRKAEVKLEVLSPKKIRAIIYDNKVPIDSKILKGEFKNGCFIIRRKILPLGIPLTIFYYSEYITMLTIDDKKDLRIHTKRLKYKNFLFYFKGKRFVESNTYRRH